MTAVHLRPRRRMLVFLLALLALAAVHSRPAAAAGRAYWVSPHGSDANPGTASRPWRTLGRAFATLRAGETAYVSSGTYGRGVSSALTWSGRGRPGAPITVAAARGQRPVLAQLVKLSGSHLRLRGFTIVRNSYPTDSRFGQGGSTPGGNVNLWADGCSQCTIAGNEIRGATMSGLFISSSDGLRLVRNWIHDNGTTHDDHGVYFSSGANGVVADNLIERNYDFGLQLYSGSGGPVGTVVMRNTIVSNGRPGSGGSGIVAEVRSGRIYDNVIANNVEFGIRGWSGGSATIARNRIFGNRGGPYYDVATGYALAGNIVRRPPLAKAELAAFRSRHLSTIRRR